MMKLLVGQTQNILSIREDTASCDAQKPKFTRDTDVFGEELGPMERKVHLETDPNVAPTVMPPRHVPVALKEKLKNKLDRLTTRTFMAEKLFVQITSPRCPSQVSHYHLHQNVYRDFSSPYSSMTQKSDTGLEERCISPIPCQEPI